MQPLTRFIVGGSALVTSIAASGCNLLDYTSGEPPSSRPPSVLATCPVGYKECYYDKDGDKQVGSTYYTCERLSTPKQCYADPALRPDCDDNDPTVYKGATETVNSRDDDCDGFADDCTAPEDALTITVASIAGAASNKDGYITGSSSTTSVDVVYHVALASGGDLSSQPFVYKNEAMGTESTLKPVPCLSTESCRYKIELTKARGTQVALSTTRIDNPIQLKATRTNGSGSTATTVTYTKRIVVQNAAATNNAQVLSSSTMGAFALNQVVTPITDHLKRFLANGYHWDQANGNTPYGKDLGLFWLTMLDLGDNVIDDNENFYRIFLQDVKFVNPQITVTSSATTSSTRPNDDLYPTVAGTLKVQVSFDSIVVRADGHEWECNPEGSGCSYSDDSNCTGNEPVDSTTSNDSCVHDSTYHIYEGTILKPALTMTLAVTIPGVGEDVARWSSISSAYLTDVNHVLDGRQGGVGVVVYDLDFTVNGKSQDEWDDDSDLSADITVKSISGNDSISADIVEDALESLIGRLTFTLSRYSDGEQYSGSSNTSREGLLNRLQTGAFSIEVYGIELDEISKTLYSSLGEIYKDALPTQARSSVSNQLDIFPAYSTYKADEEDTIEYMVNANLFHGNGDINVSTTFPYMCGNGSTFNTWAASAGVYQSASVGFKANSALKSLPSGLTPSSFLKGTSTSIAQASLSNAVDGLYPLGVFSMTGQELNQLAYWVMINNFFKYPCTSGQAPLTLSNGCTLSIELPFAPYVNLGAATEAAYTSGRKEVRLPVRFGNLMGTLSCPNGKTNVLSLSADGILGIMAPTYSALSSAASLIEFTSQDFVMAVEITSIFADVLQPPVYEKVYACNDPSSDLTLELEALLTGFLKWELVQLACGTTSSSTVGVVPVNTSSASLDTYCNSKSYLSTATTQWLVYTRQPSEKSGFYFFGPSSRTSAQIDFGIWPAYFTAPDPATPVDYNCGQKSDYEDADTLCATVAQCGQVYDGCTLVTCGTCSQESGFYCKNGKCQ